MSQEFFEYSLEKVIFLLEILGIILPLDDQQIHSNSGFSIILIFSKIFLTFKKLPRKVLVFKKKYFLKKTETWNFAVSDVQRL